MCINRNNRCVIYSNYFRKNYPNQINYYILARDCIKDSNQIEQIETKIINSLRDHTIYNNEAQKKMNYFSRILTKLSELRTIGEFGHRIIMKKIRQLLSSSSSSISNMNKLYELERKISPINNNNNNDSNQQLYNTPTTVTFSDLISNCDNLSTTMISPITTTTATTTTSTTPNQSLDFDIQAIASFFKDWPDIVDK